MRRWLFYVVRAVICHIPAHIFPLCSHFLSSVVFSGQAYTLYK
ncbi:hypothetical protein HMPREF1248_0797 [Coriobacteriaceae bacterium BV3Ac1]|nr:hypothetical protein HMPREF1248_0797 [Coriobacteriaceae bacterium BV3Ac1]